MMSLNQLRLLVLKLVLHFLCILKFQNGEVVLFEAVKKYR